ncbi:MAG: hypothetical protein PUC47_05640, partial [Oscillospiraceae bacterium]|nr:hypothetical protein [Oscillospiraceae bacterium]
LDSETEKSLDSSVLFVTRIDRKMLPSAYAPKRKAARSNRAGDARNHAESLDLSGFSAFFYFSGSFTFADLLIKPANKRLEIR